VQLPGDDLLFGEATGIDPSGRLLVKTDGGVQAVAAGDVTHLRYE
jgi:BirA family biotin operon repressor/biotin-[acetyl-CoA-carboxylase] ligase